MSASEDENGLIAELLEALRALPDVTADLAPPADADTEAAVNDVSVSLKVAGRPLAVLTRVRKVIYPRDARQVLWQIRDTASQRTGNASAEEPLPLLAAESISPGAMDLLRAERVGYFDGGGSLYLPAPGALFYVEKPPSKGAIRAIRSLFSGRRADVLHSLLLRHEAWRGVNELAEETSVSPSTVSMVLAELERLDWLDSRGQGPTKQRRVSQPTALLDGWVASRRQQPTEAARRFFVPSMTVDKLVAELDHLCASRQIDYAVTQEAAAQRYAPFLSNLSRVCVRLPIGSAVDAALTVLGARAVTEGANLLVIDAQSPGELFFRQRVNGVWLASPIQTYLDLVRAEQRAAALAEHLRQERIGF